jgi:polyhydroxyalkanoate synthesis repressor PhaR
MAILIKRYANRKLYNTQTSRYKTLKGIAELIDDGEEVRVIDNETGEDITNVALSQILVDSERSNSDVSQSLLSQILGRGGDALYDALRKGVDDASDGLGEIQDRFRRMVASSEGSEYEGSERGESEEADHSGRHHSDRRSLSDWIAYASPDFERIVQRAVERVFELLDLPRRSDIEALNQNLERVAEAVETLEKVYERREASAHARGTGPRTAEPETEAPLP